MDDVTKKLILFGIVWTMAFGAVAAQAQSLFSMQSREDGRMWEAVGRLELAGDAFCTGALVGPDLVLTAAHCLFDAASGQQLEVEDIRFLAGWRNGRASAYRRVRQAVHLPDYDQQAESSADRVRNDLALIQLQHPIRNTTITPFDTDTRPGRGARVGVVSYAHDRSEAPSLQETCQVVSRQEGILILNCSVDFGASGSPVFAFDADGQARIVSVISAKAEAQGQPVSLAAGLDGPLQRLRAAIARGDGLAAGLTRQTVGIRKPTGAKFVKP